MRVDDVDPFPDQDGAEEREEGKERRPYILIEEGQQWAVVNLETVVHVPDAPVV